MNRALLVERARRPFHYFRIPFMLALGGYLVILSTLPARALDLEKFTNARLIANRIRPALAVNPQ